MKKALILAFDFPPYASVGGQRPYSWFRHFKENGFDPTVITRHWDEDFSDPNYFIKPSSKREEEEDRSKWGTIVRVPYSASFRDKLVLKYGMKKLVLFRRILSLLGSILKFVSFRFDNSSEIFRAADQCLKTEKYDWIIATGEPFILFRYAKRLSKKHKVKWVADYRDCWSTDNSDFNLPFFNRIVHNLFFKNFELNIVKTVSLITTAAPAYKESISHLFPKKQIEVIYNGFDNQAFEQLEPIEQKKDVFEIAYAGTIYHNQNLEMFLQGLALFIKSNPQPNLQVVFYGLNFFPEQKQRLINCAGEISPYLVTTEKLTYEQTMQNLQKAHLLLLLSQKGHSKLRAKVFDYLALNRKILLVENDYAILENIMDKCNGGIKCAYAEEVKLNLDNHYREFQATGKVLHQSIDFQKYSRKQQAKVMAEVLKRNS